MYLCIFIIARKTGNSTEKFLTIRKTGTTCFQVVPAFQEVEATPNKERLSVLPPCLWLTEASRSLLLCVHTAAAASRAVAAAGGLTVFLIPPHRFYDRSDDENNDQ